VIRFGSRRDYEVTVHKGYGFLGYIIRVKKEILCELVVKVRL